MQQTKRFRKALRGLDGMTVWVHDVDPGASSDGLSRQHLQDSVVIRLLDSGLKALGIGNVPETPWESLAERFCKYSQARKPLFLRSHRQTGRNRSPGSKFFHENNGFYVGNFGLGRFQP